MYKLGKGFSSLNLADTVTFMSQWVDATDDRKLHQSPSWKCALCNTV